MDPSLLPLVIYHAACMDGIASAACAHQALQGQAEFLPRAYDQAPPDVTGRQVYILDFSFKPAELQHMLDTAQSVVMLDHHEPAMRATCAHSFCGLHKPSLFHFETRKCGARLAWEHFFPGQALPALIRVVEAHDLFLPERLELKDVHAWLERLPKTLADWVPLLSWDHTELLAKGKEQRSAREAVEALCREIEKQAHPITLAGVQGLAVNAPHELRNELGNRLAERCGTFGMTWQVTEARKVKVSLRGTAGFEVLPLAQAFGGSGHPCAASMYLPLEQLPLLLAEADAQGRGLALEPG